MQCKQARIWQAAYTDIAPRSNGFAHEAKLSQVTVHHTPSKTVGQTPPSQEWGGAAPLWCGHKQLGRPRGQLGE